ncbi:MAG: UbiA-like polyprenyltransferase [Pirellulales bacterium]|nr:UbiA-like polyprenyltransferase [Pirellulales bacterium]
MLRQTRHFLELIRFSHTVFALPFALLAAVMAWGLGGGDHSSLGLKAPGEVSWNLGQVPLPDERNFVQVPLPEGVFWWQLLGILVCMVTARSAAMAFNRLVDRDVDAANPRTRGRHLPAGLLSVPAVVLFILLSAAGFVAGTLLFLPNWLPLALSLPVLMFLCGYSYAKRFTALAHYWLGAALMLAPICAWIAIRGTVLLSNPADILPAVLLGAAVCAWVGGFDIIYACQDADFDRATGLSSLPARLGVAAALRLAAFSHAVTVLLLALLPLVYPAFGWIYGLTVAGIAGLLIYEHALVRPTDLSRVNQAFFSVNAVIGLVLLVLGSIDVWW